MSSDVDTFLSASASGDNPAASFPSVGDSVAGEIVSVPKVVETQYGDRLVIDLTKSDGTTVTLWIKQGAMSRAVFAAVKAAGATTLDVGGKLKLTYTGDGTASKPGFSPPKLYEARYEAPAPGAAVDDIFAN